MLKRLLLVIALAAFTVTAHAQVRSPFPWGGIGNAGMVILADPATGLPAEIQSTTLLNGVTGTGAGSAATLTTVNRVYHASGFTGTGAGSATVKVQGSMDGGTTWVDLGTITLTLATTASADGFASLAPWKQVRGNVTAISGTGATVSLFAGGK